MRKCEECKNFKFEGREIGRCDLGKGLVGKKYLCDDFKERHDTNRDFLNNLSNKEFSDVLFSKHFKDVEEMSKWLEKEKEK